MRKLLFYVTHLYCSVVHTSQNIAAVLKKGDHFALGQEILIPIQMDQLNRLMEFILKMTELLEN